MSDNRRRGAQSRWRVKDRSVPAATKSYRPKAERSGLTGRDLREQMLKLRLSTNEMARLSGVSGTTMTRYGLIEEPGRLPLWITTILRYARLDPWFGRRFRDDGLSYVPLRASDQDRWEDVLIHVEAVAAALIEEDPGLAFRRTISLIWSCRKLAAHMRRVRDKYRPQAINLELIDP